MLAVTVVRVLARESPGKLEKVGLASHDGPGGAQVPDDRGGAARGGAHLGKERGARERGKARDIEQVLEEVGDPPQRASRRNGCKGGRERGLVEKHRNRRFAL